MAEQRLMINAAGGGFGNFAIQFAKLYDVEIKEADSLQKREWLSYKVIDHGTDYTREDFPGC